MEGVSFAVKLCECGCGRPAPIATRNRLSKGMIKGQPLRFIHGHNGVKHGKCRRNIDQTEYKVEWARQKRKKIKEMMTEGERKAIEERKMQTRFKKGQIPWNKGKKTGQIPWNKGKTKETDEKIKALAEKVSESVKRLWMKPGYKGGNKPGVPLNLTEEQRRKYSERNKGEKNPMFGKCREFSPVWRGGVTFEPYPFEYGVYWRKEIKKRDKYTCQICGVSGFGKVHVHHIDYNKKNCNPLNLITLCMSCHGRTKRDRDFWEKFLILFNEGRCLNYVCSVA